MLESIALTDLAEKVGYRLHQQQAIVSTAESCTGGLLASTIIEVAGSSQWFDRGFITYSNQAKIDELGVKVISLQHYGAVSEKVAEEMALGVLYTLRQQPHYLEDITCYAISTTGVAGPSGGTAEKPVGMVCFSFVKKDSQGIRTLKTSTQYFNGSRSAIRQQAVKFALWTLLELIEE
ncbi:nicotinamide-nucleotide amidohydrolase family protein [Pelistega sp. NLN82]|uniref:Nicotinamide-nucleotide amidohydrolase family protein n=1 Tax=Pelistega ratti TaxID=2652177 RepID=A0A6L9Y307_9BURK|nr:nicotinamide-nucleotide amidohydrolase family protein [Pelistega ratti]NEN74722.1 nicotinamide-nucleotide amidohydrolase family protein [Pelistega ratti]